MNATTRREPRSIDGLNTEQVREMRLADAPYRNARRAELDKLEAANLATVNPIVRVMRHEELKSVVDRLGGNPPLQSGVAEAVRVELERRKAMNDILGELGGLDEEDVEAVAELEPEDGS